MKQISSLILLLLLMLCLMGCRKEERTIALDEIAALGSETLSSHLTGIDRDKIHDAWGEPDGMLSGLWGDIYKIPDTSQQIILYYDENGLISTVKVIDQIKTQ